MKNSRPRDEQGHFVKLKAGRKRGQKDVKPRVFKHPRFKKKLLGVVDQSEIQSAAPLSAPIANSDRPSIELKTKSDTQIFQFGSPPQPNENETQSIPQGEEMPPLNQPKVDEPATKPVSDEDLIGSEFLAPAIWGIENKIFVGILGNEFLPRKYVKEGADMAKGELPYDETVMMQKGWRRYLDSLGLVIESPLAQLWVFHGLFFAARIAVIIAKIKGWFWKKKSVNVGGTGENNELQKETPAPARQAPEKKTESPEPRRETVAVATVPDATAILEQMR